MDLLTWFSHHTFQTIIIGGAIASLITGFPLAAKGRSFLRVIASASAAFLGFVVFSSLIVYALGVVDRTAGAARVVGSTHDAINIAPLDRVDRVTAVAMTPSIPPAAAQPN